MTKVEYIFLSNINTPKHRLSKKVNIYIIVKSNSLKYDVFIHLIKRYVRLIEKRKQNPINRLKKDGARPMQVTYKQMALKRRCLL